MTKERVIELILFIASLAIPFESNIKWLIVSSIVILIIIFELVAYIFALRNKIKQLTVVESRHKELAKRFTQQRKIIDKANCNLDFCFSEYQLLKQILLSAYIDCLPKERIQVSNLITIVDQRIKNMHKEIYFNER